VNIKGLKIECYYVKSFQRRNKGMKKNGLQTIVDLIDVLSTAEFWAKLYAKGRKSSVPIQNFGFNILKAKALHETSKNVATIWEKTLEKKQYSDEKLVEIGFALYYVYTEQALVSAVSAAEVYFKDRLAHAIQNDNRLLRRFMDKEIKLKRIFEMGLDLSENIGILIVEKMNFQILDNIQNEYKRLFGFEPFTQDELEKLKEIFSIRHVIVHKSGIVDHLFISETGLDYQVGDSLFFEREEILQKIEFIEKIVTEFDSKLNES
jgi:hypothetical protein